MVQQLIPLETIHPGGNDNGEFLNAVPQRVRSMAYDLPRLRFAYHDLEPHLSEDLVRRHHQIHNRAYTEAINVLLRDHPELARLPIEDVLRVAAAHPRTAASADPDDRRRLCQSPIPVEGHRAGGRKPPSGELAAAIERDFGSFAGFRQQFVGACLDLVGSGWAFLCLDRPGGDTLEILTLPNNDSVLPRAKPGVLICDLWEHAYCGQYDNRRADYLEAYFQVIDWQVCEQRLLGMRAGRANL